MVGLDAERETAGSGMVLLTLMVPLVARASVVVDACTVPCASAADICGPEALSLDVMSTEDASPCFGGPEDSGNCGMPAVRELCFAGPESLSLLERVRSVCGAVVSEARLRSASTSVVSSSLRGLPTPLLPSCCCAAFVVAVSVDGSSLACSDCVGFIVPIRYMHRAPWKLRLPMRPPAQDESRCGGRCNVTERCVVAVNAVTKAHPNSCLETNSGSRVVVQFVETNTPRTDMKHAQLLQPRTMSKDSTSHSPLFLSQKQSHGNSCILYCKEMFAKSVRAKRAFPLVADQSVVARPKLPIISLFLKPELAWLGSALVQC